MSETKPMSALAPGCCSASTPCNFQKEFPGLICDVCQISSLMSRIHELESELASCRECRANLDCLSRGAVPVRDDGAERMAGLSFGAALDLAQEGLDRWREKPHNAKWWRRIDGTPIPNDLLVNIAEVIATAIQPKDTAK